MKFSCSNMLRSDRNKARFLLFSGVLCLLLFLQQHPTLSQAQAGKGKLIFEGRCSACHTLGGGAGVGPDLFKVRSWSESRIRDNVLRMQSRAGALRSQEVDELVAYLSGKNALPAASGNQAKELTNSQSRQLPEPNSNPVVAGKGSSIAPNLQSYGAELYSGKKPFKNGGPSCIACHAAAAAEIGPPLSEIVHEKSGARLYEFLLAPRNTKMRQSYKNNPISSDEASALVAFFASMRGQSRVEGENEDRVRSRSGWRQAREHEDDEDRGGNHERGSHHREREEEDED